MRKSWVVSRTVRLMLTAAVVAALTAISAGDSHARQSHNGVTFTDITAGDNVGVTYRRVRSPSSAIFDALKAQPFFTLFGDLPSAPIKSRGAPGVAVLDYDRDGDEDIYVTNGPGAANSLYANQFIESES